MFFFFQCAHGSLEDPKSVTHHKLIHAASERVLSDTKTLLEENVQDEGKGASRAGSGPGCGTLSEDVPSGAEQGDASVTRFHFLY